VIDALLGLLYPDRCPACDALTPDAPGLCAPCESSLYPLGAACPICAIPEERAPVVCAACARRPPPFARVIAPYRFGGELAVAIRRFKYGGRRGGRAELGRALGAILRPTLAAVPADRVVPVPLSPRRLRARGFSQAELLARAAGARPDGGSLLKIRETSEQAGLSKLERRRNVARAFAADRRVAGERIVLGDDVVTTGATAAAATRALLDAGAREVIVVALARAE
jgi:ComF family protein